MRHCEVQKAMQLAILFLTLYASVQVAFAESETNNAKTTACPPDAIGRSGYVERLTKRIQTEWNKTPYTKKSKRDTTVRFKISNSGKISSLEITQKSGSLKQDQAAIKTIEKLSPVDALPTDASDTVSVELSLGKRRD